MGRGKIEIKRIENTSNRQVTYSKRKNGIIKKAKEITVLCDANVSLVIYGSSGKMYEYCSPKTNLIDMLDRYQRLSGNKLWDAKHENLQNEIDRIKKENESLQIELRHLKGEDITSLTYEELIAYEDALENGLTNIREKKDEIPKIMKKRERILEDENKHLMLLVQQSEMAAMGEYQGHEPFSFRVQPMQPNLHERILVDMLDRYQRLSGNKLWDAKHDDLQSEIDKIKKENESMQIELRHLKGEDITSLNYEELIAYEEALENGLTNIRDKKDEIPKLMRKHEQALEEENKHLMYLVQQTDMTTIGDYQGQQPFSFRVQPMQPNLHDRV